MLRCFGAGRGRRPGVVWLRADLARHPPPPFPAARAPMRSLGRPPAATRSPHRTLWRVAAPNYPLIPPSLAWVLLRLAVRGSDAGCCGSTTTCVRQRLQGSAPARASSACRSSGSSSTSCRARRARRSSSPRTRTAASRSLELETGRVLAESNAILCYLAEGTPFLPADRLAARAGAAVDVLRAVQPRAERRDRRASGSLHRARPTSGAPRSSRSARSATRRSTSWSGTSRAQPFFVGERYTIADIALYAYTHVADEGGFDLGRYPARSAPGSTACARSRATCPSRRAS